MNTALLAARMITLIEGTELKAYWDKTGKVWTIGKGHVGPDVKEGLVITRAQAEALLVADLAPLLKLVADRPTIEAAALVSFGYNCGIGALRRLLKGEIALDQYGRTSGGVALPGLVARREFEAALVAASRKTS